MADDINDFIQRAVIVARSLLAQGIDLATQGGDAVSGQVQEAAEDLIEDTKASRDALVTLVRSEIERAVGRLGLVREDELAALRRHVDRLERQLAEMREAHGAAQAAAEAAAHASPAAASRPAAATAAAAGRTPAKATAKKTAAKAPAKKSTAKKATSSSAATKSARPGPTNGRAR